MTWEQFFNWLPIITAFLAAIPGAYAIRRQLKLEQAEKEKLIVEAESISADIAAKYVNAAGDLQDFYTELIEEVKIQFDECKAVVCRLEGKIDILTDENLKLKKRIEELEEGISILRKQIWELGQEPKYPKEK